MDEYNNNKIGKMSTNTINYIFIVLIIVGVSIFSFINGPTDTLVTIEEDHLMITGINDQQLRVDYADIDTLEYIEPLPELGEALEVTESGSVVSGTYQIDAYGECQVHLNTKIDACLLIQTEALTVLFNIESEDTVQELCIALEKHINGDF